MEIKEQRGGAQKLPSVLHIVESGVFKLLYRGQHRHEKIYICNVKTYA